MELEKPENNYVPIENMKAAMFRVFTNNPDATLDPIRRRENLYWETLAQAAYDVIKEMEER